MHVLPYAARRSFAAAMLALCATCTAIPAPAFAQQSAKNCDLGAQRFDNPFSDHGGWIMPRAAWHVFDAQFSFVVSETLHRITKLPRRVTGLVVPLASIAFHVRGVATHQYAFDGRDWMFDSAVRSGPLLATIPNPMYGVVIYTAAYASLFCWAHP